MYRYDLADEPEKEASLAAPPVVLVHSDSEQIQPEEQPDRRVVTIDTGSDTRVVLTHPLSSPIGSLPRTPGQEIQLPGYQEVSPRSLEGRRAADTLRVQMGWCSVSNPTLVAPWVTKKMLTEACRTLVQVKHPRSPPSWPEDTGLLTDVAGAWKQEMEGETLREPPRSRGRHRRPLTRRRKGRHGSRSLSRDDNNNAVLTDLYAFFSLNT